MSEWYSKHTKKDLADLIEKLEVKLAKAIGLALDECPFIEATDLYDDWWDKRRTTLAELKGDKP